MYFWYFVIIFPSKSPWLFIWKKLNPLQPRTLCGKFGWNWQSCSWEEDFYILLIGNYLPLEKGVALHLKKIWIPITQGCFVPSLFEIGPVVLEKKMKMWKVYRRTTGDQKSSQLSFQLRWVKKERINTSYKCLIIQYK